MANVEGTITESISTTIAPGHKVYDRDGKQVGAVDTVERLAGYFMVQPDPFAHKEDPFGEKELYVPFHLITNIDPRELFVSVSRDELYRDYAQPPARSTEVVDAGGREVAITTEPSGYTGAPLVVERVRIDQLKQLIAVGDHVYTADLTDLGTIKRYDAVTGWMLVEKGVMSGKRDLMVPVTVVDYVDVEAHEVYLVAAEADLQRMQHVEPVDVVFAEGTVNESS